VVGGWFSGVSPVTVIAVLAEPEPPRPSNPLNDAVYVPAWLKVGVHVKVPVSLP
jgi:hypothetical protein